MPWGSSHPACICLWMRMTMLPWRAEHDQDTLLCCCGSGRPGCCHQHRSFSGPLEVARAWERERELRRAASGTEVCPLHPNSSYLGKQQRKIPLLQQHNLGFEFFFFFKAPALSPSPCCAASSEAEVIFSANAMISLSANDPRTVSKINEPNLLILLAK